MKVYKVWLVNANTNRFMLFKTTKDKGLALKTMDELKEMLEDLKHIKIILSVSITEDL